MTAVSECLPRPHKPCRHHRYRRCRFSCPNRIGSKVLRSAVAKGGSLKAWLRHIGVVFALSALACPALACAQKPSTFTVISIASPAGPIPPAASLQLPGPRQTGAANFLWASPSAVARRVANWVVASGDNAGLPFVIIDKVGAKVYVFGKDGRLRGASFALLGAARGDDSAPGIGSQKLSTMLPSERTTPAGRFVAALGRDFEHDVLWIDYDKALALHRVVHGNPGDRRLQRLATGSTLDKRITYGCVNVPAQFYDDVVLPAFTGTAGIVYILPEINTIQEVFPKITGG